MEKPWLQYYDEGVPGSVEYPRIPVHQLLADAAAEHPGHTATIFGAAVGSRLMDASLTYRQLNDQVNRFAAALQGLGVKKGDRVVVMFPNSPQFIIAAYGAWRAGAILVPCNPLYVPRELEHLINDAEAETFVVMSSFYERLKSIRARTPLKRVIVSNVKEYFPPVLRFLFTLTKEKKEGHRVDISGDAETYWFQDVVRNAPATPTPVEVTPEETACLIYTGGTTGVPKGAELTHHNLVSNATVLGPWAQVREAQDVMIAVMPFFHSYGLTVGVNASISSAMSSVLIPNPRDLVHIMMAIEKHKATFFPGVPTMYVGINNHPDVGKYDLSSVRFCASGAAPLPVEVQERFQALTGARLVEAYGLTETSPVSHMNPINRNKIGTIGVPIPDTLSKIVDVETGTQDLPVGEIGEIVIQGPQVMKGYWRRPAETANVLREGWLYTGDIGCMDEEGYFQIVDRKKDMIIAGGYNIYPREVEEVLYEHPKIQEACVTGVPDERLGETVKAFVVLKAGETVTEEEIIAFCRERMARYKAPRLVEFRDTLPKTLIGKVLRRALREEEAKKAEEGG